MTKKQIILLTLASFFVGVTIGRFVGASKKGMVVINGNNNHVDTRVGSGNGCDNGCSNSAKSLKANDSRIRYADAAEQEQAAE